MDTFRMLREVERRLKNQDDKTVNLFVRGVEGVTCGAIVKIDQGNGYVEFKSKGSGSYTLIAIGDVIAVNLKDWRPESEA